MSETERELISALRGQLRECAGWDGDRISRDRKDALDYYFCRPRGDEIRGRSNVVSGDVSAMVEANLAQMLDSFSHENIAEFDAFGKADDDQAALESATVTRYLVKGNRGYTQIGTAVKDALLLRNGWCKVWTDERDVAETMEIENASAEALVAIREQVPDAQVDVLEFDEATDRAKIRVVKTVRQFRSEAVDPANMLYPKQYNKTDVQEIPFIAERHIEARSKLIDRGFPKNKVNRLRKWNQDTKVDSMARDVGEEPALVHGLDRATDLIEWFECYALVDAGDGSVERRRIALAGIGAQSLLENEPATTVPYCTGTPFINPHRLTGISLYDKLKQVQDLNTGLNRALMDNVNTVIKNRTAYLDGKVNPDDLADGRPNGNIRVRASVGNVNNAIANFQQADLSGGILQNLEYQKTNRTELGGASLELASGNMQMAGGRIGSQGVDRAFSVMEQLAAHMTKNIAETLIHDLFLLAHRTLRENFDQPVDIKVNGRWESPNPSEWPARDSVTVKIGMSVGERSRRVAFLEKTVDAQLALASQDMDDVLVNIGGFYKALTDLGRAQEIPNPEQYWVDPSTEESQKALQSKEQAQAEAAEANRNLMSMAVGLEQLRQAFEKYKHDSTLQFDYWRETLGAEIEEAKIVGSATGDLIKQTTFGSANGKGTTEAPSGGTETE